MHLTSSLKYETQPYSWELEFLHILLGLIYLPATRERLRLRERLQFVFSSDLIDAEPGMSTNSFVGTNKFVNKFALMP